MENSLQNPVRHVRVASDAPGVMQCARYLAKIHELDLTRRNRPNLLCLCGRHRDILGYTGRTPSKCPNCAPKDQRSRNLSISSKIQRVRRRNRILRTCGIVKGPRGHALHHRQNRRLANPSECQGHQIVQRTRQLHRRVHPTIGRTLLCAFRSHAKRKGIQIEKQASRSI